MSPLANLRFVYVDKVQFKLEVVLTDCMKHDQFLPRDAMLARYYAVVVCLSVCHKSVFY